MSMENNDNIHSTSYLIRIKIHFHRLNEFVLTKNDAVYSERERERGGWDAWMDGQNVRHMGWE
jgi:hypothetical protein